MALLKPYQLHLGHTPLIDMTDLYDCGTIHSEWQKYTDNSGEYKDDIYYSFDAHHTLELIDAGYAILKEIVTREFEVEYHIIMRRNY